MSTLDEVPPKDPGKCSKRVCDRQQSAGGDTEPLRVLHDESERAQKNSTPGKSKVTNVVPAEPQRRALRGRRAGASGRQAFSPEGPRAQLAARRRRPASTPSAYPG